jgi:hypothetical protein
MKFRIVFWDVLLCKMIVDNYFTQQYIPEDNSELSKDCWSWSRDFNPGPPKYEAGVLTTLPRRSVVLQTFITFYMFLLPSK